MAGLCANCICTHTEYHVSNKTTPEYQNIRTTFSSMHETIRKKIASLENQKNRIVSIKLISGKNCLIHPNQKKGPKIKYRANKNSSHCCC
jgi:hypothetical protein